MVLYHLFIVNKSGGLILNQDLSSNAPKLSSNDWLRLGSTFHSLHAIAAQVAPVVSSGIESLEMGEFKLHCFQTLTGIKFVLTADTSTPTAELVQALEKIYELYADYVLKVRIFARRYGDTRTRALTMLSFHWSTRFFCRIPFMS
jgi:hypothetical protein